MDQSISLLAEQGTAKLIEFNPIRATDVAVPAGTNLPHGVAFLLAPPHPFPLVCCLSCPSRCVLCTF